MPPTYRKRISTLSSTGYSWASRALSLGGKTLWVVSTSALLLGVPWALAFSEEQQVQEMEKEMRMQQSANEVCSSCLPSFARGKRHMLTWDDTVAHARHGGETGFVIARFGVVLYFSTPRCITSALQGPKNLQPSCAIC